MALEVLDPYTDFNEKGQALLYSWTATAPVNFEVHAEPDGAPKGYAQTYEKKDSQRQASGTLTAPFPGIHGWFWENTTDAPVTVTLKSAGFYNLAHLFKAEAWRIRRSGRGTLDSGSQIGATHRPASFLPWSSAAPEAMNTL
jgi:hypothetical protein